MNIPPYFVMFQFPSGEWSVERYERFRDAETAAGDAAQEVAGREVYVTEKRARFTLWPGEVVED